MHGHSTAAAARPVRYSLVQLCVLALVLASAAGAQDSVLEAQQVLRVANAAYEDGDLKRFVSELEKALELNPASLATRYNLACGHARIGNTERALELLTDLVTARADFGMADDPDLESLRDQPEFHKLLAALEQNIPAGSTSIQPLDTSIKLVGTNGVAVSGDGRVLFASSYPVGIARVDLTTGATQFLDVPKGATLYEIDGLYEYRGDLVAIQNGTQPWRLIRLALNADRSAVIDLRHIEFANAALTATTGAIIGDEIHYLGQGPPPDPAPGHVPPALVPLFGKILIMAAPLE